MYLRDIVVANSGPIERFEFQFVPIGEGSAPGPLILVGSNGTGKSNLLSILGDSFYEGAAAHFQDITPSGKTSLQRPWFRMLGPWSVRRGEPFTASVLRYEIDGVGYLYHEKIGSVPAEFTENLPVNLRGANFGEGIGSSKSFDIPADIIQTALSATSLVYYPSSRAEMPYWQNESALDDTQVDIRQSYERELARPIYVQRGLEAMQQWILSLLIDKRLDFNLAGMGQEEVGAIPITDRPDLMSDQIAWGFLSSILTIILDDESARFVWGHRRQPLRLGFSTGGENGLPLSALSAGEATLLNLFGTLMRYGDKTSSGPLPLNVRGVCVVDEIDAHMHVDLQYRALPQLMKLFPKVQFIVSTLSPLFVLGMEKHYGDDVTFLDMPNGTPIQPEAYSEFESALEVVHQTAAFNERVLADARDSSSGTLRVWCEGETDPKYIVAAARSLGRSAILESAEIEWVGAKDERGQAFNTGKEGLDRTRAVFLAKPSMVERPVLLLYDNDTNKHPEDHSIGLYVRAIPSNTDNTRVKGGIENLLPSEVFSDEFYETKRRENLDGGDNTTRTLKKMALCEALCERRDPNVFAGFGVVLDLIESIIAQVRQ